MRQGWLSGLACMGIVAMLAAAAASADETQFEPPSTAESEVQPDRSGPSPEENRLVAIGALTGAHLYTTYAYIGSVADSHRRGDYKPQRVRDLMTEVTGLIETSSKHLNKVRGDQLAERDKKVIDDFLAAYELLNEEAQALIAYSRSESHSDQQRFRQARHTTWPKLKRILGIKEPLQEAEQ